MPPILPSSLLLVLSLAATPAAQVAGMRPELPRQAAPVRELLAEGGDAADEEEAAFRIDGELVPAGFFGEWLLRSVGSRRVLHFAESWVVEREGRRRGVVVTDEEIDARIDADVAIRVEHAFLGKREDWLAELERTGRNEREYRIARATELRPYLIARALAAENRVVPEHHLLREWELRHGRNGYRYDLRKIFLRVLQDMEGLTPGNEDFKAAREAVRGEVRARALEIRAEWEAGADFGELAQRYSEDEATRAGAGVPAQPFRHFGWPHAFNDALEGLAPGEVSEPLWGRGGWWLIEMGAIEHTPLESVREELTRVLLERGPESDEIGAVQQRLMEGVALEILPAMFERPTGSEWPEARQPVMTIDGEPVSRTEYATWLVRGEGATWQNRFIEDWLLEREAAALGIELSEAEVDARAKDWVEFRLSQVHRGRREALDSYLQASGMGMEVYVASLKWRARSDLLAERLILRERTVSDEELRLVWRDLYGPQGKGLEVRSLATAFEAPELPPGLGPDELHEVMERAAAVALAQAEALVRRARAGEDFASLARREGARVKPTRVSAEIGRFRADQWPDEIAEAVLSLEPGEVTAPLRYGLFWLVFEAVRKTEVPFESVREELRAQLLERRPFGAEIAAFRNQLLKQSAVEVLPGAVR